MNVLCLISQAEQGISGRGHKLTGGLKWSPTSYLNRHTKDGGGVLMHTPLTSWRNITASFFAQSTEEHRKGNLGDTIFMAEHCQATAMASLQLPPLPQRSLRVAMESQLPFLKPVEEKRRTGFRGSMFPWYITPELNSFLPTGALGATGRLIEGEEVVHQRVTLSESSYPPMVCS